MARLKRFTFLCDDQERKLVRPIADRLNRSQSDAMRFLIRQTALELGIRTRALWDKQQCDADDASAG